MNKVSDSVIRRFPVYYRHILAMQKAGVEYTSARRLQELTGIHKTQIRKDIGLTGLVGVPRVGHNVNCLVEAIRNFLSWDHPNPAVLVGAGNLGRAILNYQGFIESGTQIVAAFDNNPKIIGKRVNNIKIYSLDFLKEICSKKDVSIGIISTPEKQAQSCADLLIEAGVYGIWNFTQAQLSHPDNVIVETVDLYRGLGVISKRISESENKIKIKK